MFLDNYIMSFINSFSCPYQFQTCLVDISHEDQKTGTENSISQFLNNVTEHAELKESGSGLKSFKLAYKI